MPPKQSEWRNALFVRGVTDHIPGVTLQYVTPGRLPVVQGEVLSEVKLEGATVEDLVLRVVEWSRLQGPKVLTYRSVLYDSGKYYAFMGMSTK